MSDLQEQLLRLAERGEPRGADAVVAAAARAAGEARVNGNGDAGSTVVTDLEPIDVVARPTRRSPWRTAVAVAGVAALLGVGMVAVTAIGSRGGASSPEGAVRALAKAIDAGDPLAAVDVVAPDEVRQLRDSVNGASQKAAELRIVDDASAPLHGIDLNIDNLELATEPLADGYVKVHVTSGTLTASAQRQALSQKLQRDVTRDGRTQIDLARERPYDVDPFVVAIRRDGHWYVSAAYTVLEYVRAANHLPAADYGSGLTSQLGAASPDAAATGFVRALAAHDWNTVFSLIPPSEIPLYDYRSGLAQLFDEQHWDFTVSDVTATADVHGDTADVSVNANGTYPSDGRTSTWTARDDCLETNGSGVESLCLSSRGLLPYSYLLDRSNNGPVHVRAVQVDGRWYLSPVETAERVLDGWVRNFDARTYAALVRDYSGLTPDGTITLDKATTFHTDGSSVAIYAFSGTQGQQVVASQPDGQNQRVATVLTASIARDDGKLIDDYGVLYGEPFTLPADGTYWIVVSTYGAGDHTFTLWDAKDAPKSAIDPYSSSSCTSSSSSSSSSASIGGEVTTCYGSGINTVPPNGVSVGGTTATTAVAAPTSTTGG